MSKTALYQVIADDIARAIVGGSLKKGDRLPSEQDLMEKYEVSRITARRALQELVDEDLIYRRKGSGSYVTGVFPRGIDGLGVDSKIIALAIPFGSGMGGSFDLVRGASDYLSAQGYLLTVEHTSSALKERQFLLSLPSSPLTGFLFYPIAGQANLDVILQLDDSPIPIVFLDKYFEGTSLISVVPDNYGGTRRSVEHLVSLGHRQIGFVSSMGLVEASSARDRYRGYCAGLRDAGIHVAIENVVAAGAGSGDLHSKLYEELTASDSPAPAGESLMLELLSPLLDRSDPITAIVALNDYLAINIVRTLVRQGLRIPDDVSVVGFDNIELSSHIEVPITTVNQDFYEAGVTATRTLLNRLKGEKDQEGRPVVLPTELVVRNSTAAVGLGYRSLGVGSDRVTGG